MRKRACWSLISLLAATACSSEQGLLSANHGAERSTNAAAACQGGALLDTTRFDMAYRKACHNCYEPQYAATLAAALDAVASIEIDFHDEKEFLLGGAMDGNWYVRHGTGGGNDSNCSAPGDLTACLKDVRAWSDAHPGHEVITVFLDKKQDWGDTRRPVDLDRLVLSSFGRDRIFTPADLRGAFPSARAAAEAGAWPTLGALRGKLIVALTGGTLLDRSSTQHEYVSSRGASAALFVAADAATATDITGVPRGFDEDTASWLVFHNLDKGAVHLGPLIRQRNHVARVWGIDEGDASYRAAVGLCVNFVALYGLP